LFSFSSFSQSETKILTNGVVVYNSIGVEGIVPEPNKMKDNVSEGIDTWSLDVCLQFREDVKNKLTEAPTKEDALHYALKLKEIEERILLLESKK
jgi:hypothetical protein